MKVNTKKKSAQKTKIKCLNYNKVEKIVDFTFSHIGLLSLASSTLTSTMALAVKIPSLAVMLSR